MGNGLLTAGSVGGVDLDPDFAEPCGFADLVCPEESDWDAFFWEFADGASGGGLWLLCCPHASQLANSSNAATSTGTLRRDSFKHSIPTILDVFSPVWVGESARSQKFCGGVAAILQVLLPTNVWASSFAPP